MKAEQVKLISRSFNFEHCFVVNRNGMGGGLALFWSSDVNLNITSYSAHHIDAVVHNESGTENSQKHHTWTFLKRLASIFSYLCYCFGDFNEIMHLYEKHGGNDRNLNSMVEFREAVQASNLVDMGFKGHPFTWSNRKHGAHYIEERLDRVLCSKDWSSNFMDSLASNLIHWVSDHCPVLFEVKERCNKNKYVSRSFPRYHYEDMWSSYEACKNIVKDE